MKKLYSILLMAALFTLGIKTGHCTVHNIVGTPTSHYSPDSVSAVVGDTIIFTLASFHSALEVSQATWNVNGNTSNAGFSVPFGGGMTVVDSAKIYYYVCGNHFSMGMKGRIFVTSSTGIQSPAATVQKLEVFPNPATSWVTIKANLQPGKENNLKIFNLLGNCIYQKENIPFPGYLNLNGLPGGIYFMEVRAEGVLMQRKFVVER